MPAWAPNFTSFRSATVVAPAAGEPSSADDRLVARVVRVERDVDVLLALGRDRVLLEVEVEVLRAGLDRLVEAWCGSTRRRRPRSPSRRRRRRRRRPRSLAPVSGASSMTHGGNAGSPVAIVSVPASSVALQSPAPPVGRRSAPASQRWSRPERSSRQSSRRSCRRYRPNRRRCRTRPERVRRRRAPARAGGRNGRTARGCDRWCRASHEGLLGLVVHAGRKLPR